MKITTFIVNVDGITTRTSKAGVPYSYANCSVGDSKFLAFVNTEEVATIFPCKYKCELHNGRKGLVLRLVEMVKES